MKSLEEYKRENDQAVARAARARKVRHDTLRRDLAEALARSSCSQAERVQALVEVLAGLVKP